MYWSSIDCLLGRFFSCYILVLKFEDFIVDCRSKPWIFFDPLVGRRDGLDMFVILRPLNWGKELFFFISYQCFYSFKNLVSNYRIL